MRKFIVSIALLFIVIGLPVIAFAQGALPDVTDPAASGSFVWHLYKAGHLIPAITVGLFAGLTIAEKRFAWLRTGARKVYVAAALAGLAMLAERAASGTTPNVGMFMGALGAAFTMWMKTHGPTEPAKA